MFRQANILFCLLACFIFNVQAQKVKTILEEEPPEPTIKDLLLEIERLDTLREAYQIGQTYYNIAELGIVELNDSIDNEGGEDLIIRSFLNAIQYFDVAQERDMSIGTQADLGRFYMSENYFAEADGIFDSLSNYFRLNSDSLGVAYMHQEMADIALATGKFDLAAAMLDSVKIIFNTHSDSTLTKLYNFTFSTLTKAGDNTIFIDDSLYVSLSKTTDSLANPNYYSTLLMNNGTFYMDQGKYDIALHNYLKARNESGSNPDRIRESYLYLSEIYALMGDYKSSVGHLKNYNYVNDSVVNLSRLELLRGLTNKASEMNQIRELEDMKRDNKIAEITARSRTLLNYGLGIGAFIMLIVTYFIIRNYQSRLHTNQIIGQQKEEITKRRITDLENNLKIETMHSMLSGQEAERERIAKDLHDSLGGLLSTVKLHFDAIQTKNEVVTDMQEYEKANFLLDEACKEVRNISNNMQPGALLKLGIVAAVSDLINRLQSPGQPNIDFQHFGINGRLDNSISLNIYRIVQELMYNSIKHANAEEILVQLIQKDDEFMIMVEDDGDGYDSNEVQKGMGSENISSRVNYLKGDLSIHSMKGTGTTTLINIPV